MVLSLSANERLEVPPLIPDKLSFRAYLIHRRPKTTLEVSLINALFSYFTKAFTSNSAIHCF